MNEIQSLNVQLLTYKPDRQDMGDLKALAASIAEKGVIQPLLVRPASGAAPGEALKMVIVAGRRLTRRGNLRERRNGRRWKLRPAENYHLRHIAVGGGR